MVDQLGDAASAPGRRGAATRRRAQQVALRLFTERGYEATSLRHIAEELGINKASLYYHFDGKEAIVRSLVDERGDEADALLAWVREQPAGPGVVREAVLRWVGSATGAKLQGIRFLTANPLLFRPGGDGDTRIGGGLTQLAETLAERLPHPTAEHRVLLRMALLSVNAAVQAAAPEDPDDAVVAAAQRAAAALCDLLEADG